MPAFLPIVQRERRLCTVATLAKLEEVVLYAFSVCVHVAAFFSPVKMSHDSITVVRILPCALTLHFGLLKTYLEERGTFLTVESRIFMYCLVCVLDLQPS